MKLWHLLLEVLLQIALTIGGSIPGKQASVALDDPAPSLIHNGKGECCLSDSTRSQHGGTGSYTIIEGNAILHLHVTTHATFIFLPIYPGCSTHFSQSVVSAPPVVTLSPIMTILKPPMIFIFRTGWADNVKKGRRAGSSSVTACGCEVVLKNRLWQCYKVQRTHRLLKPIESLYSPASRLHRELTQIV